MNNKNLSEEALKLLGYDKPDNPDKPNKSDKSDLTADIKKLIINELVADILTIFADGLLNNKKFLLTHSSSGVVDKLIRSKIKEGNYSDEEIKFIESQRNYLTSFIYRIWKNLRDQYLTLR